MNNKCAWYLLLSFFLTFLIHATFHIADFRKSSQNQVRKLHARTETNLLVPDGSTDRLFWFVQLSDLHLSHFRDSKRIDDFSTMCHVHIRVIAPDIIIVSGDITDAKFPSMRGSKQFKEEWEAYKRIINDSGVSEKALWLDLRGNHGFFYLINHKYILDDFNVPSVNHPDNYFRRYSMHGLNFTQSYISTHHKSFGTYSFIGLDACPSPGLKRPLNFFGLITPNLAKSLKSFSARAQGSNQTFWFGHYTTSTIISPGFDLRSFISETAYCYLCGHLHTMLKMAPNMYTVQPQGFLELELADWRDGRFFRIMAVDNDLVSFVDSQMRENAAEQWPIVLITNPKDAAFLLPNKEPTDRILKSTHIRILAWSIYPITRVSVTVDGEYLGDAKPAIRRNSTATNNSPLFVLPWDPTGLGPNVHSIKVICEDAQHNIGEVQQFFSLDGNPRWNFGGFQSFLLLGSQASRLMTAFYLIWSVPFFILITARVFGKTRLYGRVFEDICQLEGLHQVANCHAFTAFIFYLVYILYGPIYIGYLLDNSIGAVFTFGVIIQNVFVPERTTYLSESIQQIIFTYPLLLLLIHRMRAPRKPHCLAHIRYCSWLSRCYSESFIMCLLTTLQLAFVILTVLLPYGWMAFCLSPGRLWLVVLAWTLFVYTGRLARMRWTGVYSGFSSAINISNIGLDELTVPQHSIES